MAPTGALLAPLAVPPSTSFWAVKCAPGFTCVSKLTSFPLGHDGVYHHPHGIKSMEPSDPDRFRDWLQTYEVGCPARGQMTEAGKCKDNGEPIEEQGLCYSTKGFEGGPDAPCQEPDECLCVKAQTPRGKLALGFRNLENEEGKELLSGTYEVQEVTKCGTCEDLSFDRKHCEECQNCEFKTMTMEGELVEGCWPRDGGSARRKHLHGEAERIYLHDLPAELKDLSIVPHYSAWDPGEKVDPVADEGSHEAADQRALAFQQGTRMPYQSVREPLSRENWIAMYKLTAPRIQGDMDKVVSAAMEDAAKAKTLRCEERNGKHVGEDVPGKLEKAYAVQQACLRMQETANRIAVGDANKGFARIGGIECGRSRGSEGACEYLNCHVADDKFKDALATLKKRNDACYEEWENTAEEDVQTCLPQEAEQVTAPVGAAKPGAKGQGAPSPPAAPATPPEEEGAPGEPPGPPGAASPAEAPAAKAAGEATKESSISAVAFVPLPARRGAAQRREAKNCAWWNFLAREVRT